MPANSRWDLIRGLKGQSSDTSILFNLFTFLLRDDEYYSIFRRLYLYLYFYSRWNLHGANALYHLKKLKVLQATLGKGR